MVLIWYYGHTLAAAYLMNAICFTYFSCGDEFEFPGSADKSKVGIHQKHSHGLYGGPTTL